MTGCPTLNPSSIHGRNRRNRSIHGRNRIHRNSGLTGILDLSVGLSLDHETIGKAGKQQSILKGSLGKGLTQQ